MGFETPEEKKELTQEQIKSLSYVLNLVNCPEDGVIEACNADAEFFENVSKIMQEEKTEKEKGGSVEELFDQYLDQAA